LEPIPITDETLDQLADRAQRAARVQPAVRTYLGHFSPDVAAFYVDAPSIVDALVQEIRRLRAIDVARKARARKPKSSSK
jgi:hypothetical protein